jgi:signal transduction histidine kinase
VVRADPNMVRLVLRNLVGNAIKFTPQNGTITVAAKQLESQWEISVADTGVGILPQDRAKIFGAGNLHTTLGTAREKGTGLGLRLCKEFVERNEGRISFESIPGKGSTFRFTLPLAEPDPLLADTPPMTTVVAAE